MCSVSPTRAPTHRRSSISCSAASAPWTGGDGLVGDEDGVVEPKNVFACVSSPDVAQRTGHVFVQLFANAGTGMVNRHEFVRGWSQAGLTVLSLLHDDQHGVFLFERMPPPPGQRDLLANEGYELRGDVSRFDVECNQKGFTATELHDIARRLGGEGKPPSEREARAVEHYEHAIIVGLRKFAPSLPFLYYLDGDLWTDASYWAFYGDYQLLSKPLRIDEDEFSGTGVEQLIAFWPSDTDLRDTGLKKKRY